MALNTDVIGKKIGPLTKRYTWHDAVLYALGVGAGFDDLEYVYENRLKVIPSFSIASVFDFLAEVGISANVNLSGILHGEQDLIFHSPIPTEGELTTEGTITNIWDKGADNPSILKQSTNPPESSRTAQERFSEPVLTNIGNRSDPVM